MKIPRRLPADPAAAYQAGYEAAILAIAQGHHTPRRGDGRPDPLWQFAELRALAKRVDRAHWGWRSGRAPLEALHTALWQLGIYANLKPRAR